MSWGTSRLADRRQVVFSLSLLAFVLMRIPLDQLSATLRRADRAGSGRRSR
jgi:hypothetical protein